MAVRTAQIKTPIQKSLMEKKAKTDKTLAVNFADITDLVTVNRKLMEKICFMPPFKSHL